MERQERRTRIILFVAFLITLVCLGLIGGAFGSDYWVTSDVLENVKSFQNTTSSSESTAHHGLFKGEVAWRSSLNLLGTRNNIGSKRKFLNRKNALLPLDGKWNVGQ